MSAGSPPPRAISPPTPAPSPQPELHAHLRLASALSQHHVGPGASNGQPQSSRAASQLSFDPNDPQPLLKHLSIVLPQLSSSARHRFLTGLVDLFDLRELAHLSSELGPRLKVDFLSSLPIEVSLHILSFIDDPKTLARASRVSRFWRSLVNDEHTWKAMCLKHRYRRRASSSAGISILDDRLQPHHPHGTAATTPRFAPPSSRLMPLSEATADGEAEAEADYDDDDDDDDSTVLASLYQRYRARGLDPSNALHELRTLHDLFLSKQDDGGGNLADQMSDADKAFYAQLEEIVAEESRERYGDGRATAARSDAAETQGMDEDDEQLPQPSASTQAITSSSRRGSSNVFGSANAAGQPDDHPSASSSSSSSSSNLGWLGAGPSAAGAASSTSAGAAANAARISAPAHAISSAYRTPSGRLDRLRNWQDPRASGSAGPAASGSQTSTSGATGLGLGLSSAVEVGQASSAVSADDTEMAAVDAGSSAAPPIQTPSLDPLPRSPNPLTAALRQGLPQIPAYDSPTNRFSTSQSSAEASGSGSGSGSRSSRHDLLVPGRTAAMATPTAPRLDGSWPQAAGGGSAIEDGQGGANPVASTSGQHDPSSSKKARRRSAPAVDAHGQPLGLGRPYEASADSLRSATLGHAGEYDGAQQQQQQQQQRPFSYRTHFKLAYLTESNWMRGGRFQTKHESSDAGAVVTSLAIDSEWIVVGMANSKIHVFDAETGLYSQTLLGHESGVWCLTLVSRTGKKRRAASGKPTMVVPSYVADEIERNRSGAGQAGRGAMPSMAELGGNAVGLGNPCGSVGGYGNEDAIVVSGGCDRDVRVWDLGTGECRYVLSGHTSTTRCLKVLEGRPIAVSGSRDSTLRVWDIARGEHVHLLAGHQHSVRCMEVAGNRVASGSYDCNCRVWDVDTGECLRLLRGHIHQIYAVAFDGERVATGSLDSTVRVWSVSSGECVALFQGHTSLVGQLQLTDKMLVTGGSDGRVIVFSLETFECVHRLCAHDNSVTCLQFDERYIITGGNDGRVKLWDFATGRYIRDVCEPCEQVWKVSYYNDQVVVLCKRGERTCMDVISFRPTVDEF
ncbi:uncharacterized protein PFL1_05292 [Pseudozyma flocculosa PF-1]|uniref:F-box domain-containing protein n=1 Tax=Pseudozyma flocculosa PF-1 TaxID=1277687 RepID=A0A061H3F9_9BASI|nr:uncharacterized protein PFL1_05292 [Pseudozyma flocculosa PF-1]EPQ27008.1 hypothetical protein PFL1_05292 [Pseudozyma flocculosa PF-1]